MTARFDKRTGHGPAVHDDQAASAEVTVAAESGYEPVATRISHVVETREETPPNGGANCVVLTALSPVQLLLPLDPARRCAVIIAVDNDIYLATSLEEAQSVAGANTGTTAFYLPAGIAVPVNAQSALWAAATTTATMTRVSVLYSRG